MTRPDSHTRYEELAAGMALHSLEPEDEQEFLAHLSGCELCERDLLEHEAALAHLAYAADSIEPPPSLLEGIRAGVRASGRAVSVPSEPAAREAGVPDEPAARRVGVPDEPADRAPSVPYEAAPAPVPVPDSLAGARRRREERTRRVPSWLGVAAAAALVVPLGIWTAELREQRDAQVQVTAQLADTLKRLQDPSTETVRLEAESGGVVAVALVAGSGEVELVLDGLPVNDADTSYVLWGESPDGSVAAVAGFDVTSAELQVRRGIRVAEGIQRLMVTREPDFGDTLPTEPTLPVLAVGVV